MVGPLEGRFLELTVTPPEDYPKVAPEIKFRSKINAEFVDKSGLVQASAIATLSAWKHSFRITDALAEIKSKCDGLPPSVKQPEEGETF